MKIIMKVVWGSKYTYIDPQVQGASHICPEACEAQWWKLWKMEVVGNTEDMAMGAMGALSSAVKVESGNIDGL